MGVQSHQSANLLSRLPQEMSKQLFGSAVPVQVHAGQALFVAGDAGNGCYRLDEGLLKVSIVSSKGAERMLSILAPGSVVGEIAMLDGLPRTASVFALRDSRLRFISRSQFAKFSREHPEIYRHLVMLLASRLRETDEDIATTSFLPLRERLVMTLLELAEHFGDDPKADRVVIRQRFTQNDLAAMAAVSRENISRILADMKRRNIISRASGYYRIESRTALEREMHS
jgi:CRP/FNR family transcriptional regulator, cyclic AMP receptor protein